MPLLRIARTGRPIAAIRFNQGWAENAECRAQLAQNPFPLHFPENPRTAAIEALPYLGDSETTLTLNAI